MERISFENQWISQLLFLDFIYQQSKCQMSSVQLMMYVRPFPLQLHSNFIYSKRRKLSCGQCQCQIQLRFVVRMYCQKPQHVRVHYIFRHTKAEQYFIIHTFSDFARYVHSRRHVVNFFISLKLYAISGLAQRDTRGERYFINSAAISPPAMLFKVKVERALRIRF